MMDKPIWKRLSFGLIVILGLALGPEEDAMGDSLKKTIDMVVAINTAASKAQNRIDNIDDQADQLISQYRDLERQRESLRVYNEQIEKLVVAQRARMDDIQNQINDAAMMGRELTPLMFRMLDNLEEFINLDVPFMREERTARIKGLRETMNKTDVADSEKFRQVLDAYLVELEHGKVIEEYKGKLTLDGAEREVEFLKIGRLALVYRSIDGKKMGVWDREAKDWQELPRKFFSSVQKGFRMARKQSAPNLIHLPVSAPKEVQ
ncbi:MAG: DUF3450 domain-containing protein [Myxococcota bacterium]|nr:DUF3450 domain-containing protein [Myxococcota bacterium]